MRKPGNQRALKVIRSLRLRHQKQTQQIDILCNDMVSAHRHFADKLGQMLDVSRFYEALLSCGTLQEIVNTVLQSLSERIDGCNVVLFLADESGFETHRPASVAHDDVQTLLESCFSRQLVLDISLGSRVCSQNQLLQMGLQAPPSALKSISSAAIPLNRPGQAVGFLFIYRPADLPLTGRELASASAVSAGLCSAIQNLQTAKQALQTTESP